jgi:hypothetical protein
MDRAYIVRLTTAERPRRTYSSGIEHESAPSAGKNSAHLRCSGLCKFLEDLRDLPVSKEETLLTVASQSKTQNERRACGIFARKACGLRTLHTIYNREPAQHDIETQDTGTNCELCRRPGHADTGHSRQVFPASLSENEC